MVQSEKEWLKSGALTGMIDKTLFEDKYNRFQSGMQDQPAYNFIFFSFFLHCMFRNMIYT